jgi:hypothetical protein
MLGAIAVVALVVGSIGATVSVSQHDHQAAAQARTPVVEVQAVQGVDSEKD